MTTNNGNGNGAKSSEAKRRAFIQEYPKYGSVGETIRAIGVRNRRTFYNWCDAHPDFKKIYDEVLKPNRIDELLTTAYQIATAGKLKNKKNTFGFEIDASAPQVTLIKYLLSVFDPETYAERHLLEGKGKSGEFVIKVVYDDGSDKDKQ